MLPKETSGIGTSGVPKNPFNVDMRLLPRLREIPKTQERLQTSPIYSVRVQNQPNVGKGNSWTILVSNGTTENVILRCESEKVANEVKENFIKALKTLAPSKQPKITFELDTSFNLIFRLNGAQLRSVDVTKVSEDRIGDMAVWAFNLKKTIGAKSGLDTRPLAQARLFKRFQPNIGRSWSRGVWDCTLCVHAMVPNLDNEGGDGNGPQNMTGHVMRDYKIKPKSIAEIQPGEITVKLRDDHGYLEMCVGRDSKGRNIFIDLENSGGEGTHTAVYIGAEKYANFKTFVLNQAVLPDPFYTKHFGESAGLNEASQSPVTKM